MSQSKIFTIRVESSLQQELDELAKVMDRPRNWVVKQAISEYLQTQAWQVEQIRRGLADADAGNFVPEKEVKKFFAKYKSSL